MRCIAIAILPATALLAQGQVPSPETPGERPALIQVSGEGRLEVKPDLVRLYIAVETRARAAVNATSQNAERMAAVLKALRGLGLEEGELATTAYSLRREAWRTPNDTVHVATNGIRVETQRLDLLGRIIDTSLVAGANSIGTLQFGVVRNDSLQRLVLVQAVKDARSRAEAIATALGGQLGALEDISSLESGPQATYYELASPLMREVAAAPTPVVPREISLTARVTARWRFIGGR
jgi:uncharacterized protein YggE